MFDTNEKRTSDQIDNTMFKLIVENLPDSIILTSLSIEAPGPIILYVNPAFTKLTGFSKEEVIGKTPRMFQGELTDRKTLDKMKETLKEKDTFRDKIINYKKDGTPFTIEWNISAIRDKNGKIILWLSSQREIIE